MKNKNPDKDMAELYYNLYNGCLKYKNEKKNKEVDCQKYYEQFEKFAIKYVDSKEDKTS